MVTAITLSYLQQKSTRSFPISSIHSLIHSFILYCVLRQVLKHMEPILQTVRSSASYVSFQYPLLSLTPPSS